MTWEQVFTIINQLIDVVNDSYSVVSGVITDGQIDYNGLANRPSINGVELEANKTQADLLIDVDTSVRASLNEMEGRVASAETDSAAQLQRIATLETNRVTDRADIDGLTPYKARVQTLETERTADSGRIDLLDERYSSLHTVQTSEQAKVTALQESDTTRKENITELKDRVIAVINRLNPTARTAQEADFSLSCSGEKLPSAQCIADISNSFTFD